MKLGQAFTFIFEDEDWIVKILLGVAVSLVPIAGQIALLGYMLDVVRNVRHNHPRPLPAWGWNEIGQYLLDGLKFWVVNLVYSLPAIVLSCPVSLAALSPIFLPFLARDNTEMILPLFGVSWILILVVSLPSGLYGLFLALLSPALLAQFAETREISDCLRFKEMARFAFAHVGSIIIAILVTSAAAIIVIAPIAMLTMGLLAMPAGVWMNLCYGHMCGQIARRADQTAAA